MTPARNRFSSRRSFGALRGLCVVLLCLAPLAGAPAPAAANGPSAELHAPWATLLSRYLVRERVRYLTWWGAESDRQRLIRYVDSLEAQLPSRWREADAKAYWINLYNAATIELVLEHYPIDSIKDIGGVLGSPWGKKFLQVEGRPISLEIIEHDILRKRFADPRIHFALNCASVSCPPLLRTPYVGDSLDVQLDAVTKRALNDTRNVVVSGSQLRLSKLFDWYRDDFERKDGSVEAFLARYRSDVAAAPKSKYKYFYVKYDWALNEAR